ncbi:MAG: 5-oxoprolinase subunit PxpB [Aliiglaciecola sp.]
MGAFEWCVASENSIILYARQGSLAQRNEQIRLINEILLEKNELWLIDTVMAYDSLLVQIDPLQIDFFALKRAVDLLLDNTKISAHARSFPKSSETAPGQIKILPVWYRAPVNNDLARVAKHHSISVDEVIARHTAEVYQVYCCGFAPGFAYMGETDLSIAMPRLNTPRKKVPKGAVAIADRQTAIYPNESPGGWNILGLCPYVLFDRDSSPPTRLNVGDKVKFEEIDQKQYQMLLAKGGT